MASRYREQAARRIDPGPRQATLGLNRSQAKHILETAAGCPDIEDRGHAVEEKLPQYPVNRERVEGKKPAGAEMNVHVGQAGHDELAGGIDQARSVGNDRLVGIHDPGDRGRPG